MPRRILKIAFPLLIAGVSMPAAFARTHRKVTRTSIEYNDACRLWPAARVARAIGAAVHTPLVEPTRAVTIAEGRVLETVSACTYTTGGEAGKPLRVRLEVRAFRTRNMLAVTWRYSGSSPQFNNARQVANLGEEAWQGQALRLRQGHFQLLIEADDAPPWMGAGASADAALRAYPEVETALARLALSRLGSRAPQGSAAATRKH